MSNRQQENDRKLIIFACLVTIIFVPLAAIVYVRSVDASAFCTPDEKTTALCMRQWFGAAGNILAVIAASLAALYAFRQASAAQRQADAALKSLEIATQAARADRAWMLQSGIEPTPFTDGYINGEFFEKGQTVRAVWFNFGRTPALNVNIYAAGAVVGIDDDTPTFQRPTPPPDSQGALAPSQRVTSKEWAWPHETTQALLDRKVKIFLYSRADYKDIYGTTRASERTLAIEVQRAILPNGDETLHFVSRIAGPQQEIY